MFTSTWASLYPLPSGSHLTCSISSGQTQNHSDFYQLISSDLVSGAHGLPPKLRQQHLHWIFCHSLRTFFSFQLTIFVNIPSATLGMLYVILVFIIASCFQILPFAFCFQEMFKNSRSRKLSPSTVAFHKKNDFVSSIMV